MDMKCYVLPALKLSVPNFMTLKYCSPPPSPHQLTNSNLTYLALTYHYHYHHYNHHHHHHYGYYWGKQKGLKE